MRKTSVLFILFFLFLLVETGSVDACTCKGRPRDVKGVQTCSYYWYAESVFIGKAENVTIDRAIGQMKVTFSVEKQIRGAPEKTVEIFTCAHEACCGYPFKEGERYFVYGRKSSDGKLHEALCGPTVLLKDAEDDLEYVREIESGKLGTRIFGNVYEDRQPTLKDKRTFEPLANIEVTIEGKKKKFKTATDEKGFYLFKEIPEGSYRVTAKFPNGFREIFTREDLNTHFAGVNLAGVRCDSENFVATRQGSIRGRVVDFPVNDIKNPWSPDSPQPKVSLLPLDENGNVMPYRAPEERWAYRDKYEFYFNAVPAGKYLLAINPNNCPYPNNGVPTMFFPGVADKPAAKIITVGEGEQVILEDFRSLPMLKERWFSGEVIYADKTPATNVTVRLTDGNMNKCGNFHTEVKTDESGRFKIKGYETYEYKINAFRERKNGQKQLYAKPFVIPKEGNSDNIQLILDVTF